MAQATAPVSDSTRWSASQRQADHPMHLLAVADAPCVFPPGSLLGIAEQIRPGDVMVVPRLAAAQAGEVGFRAVGAGPVDAVALLVVDPPHREPGVQLIPGRALIGMQHGGPGDPLGDGRQRGFLGRHHLHQRGTAALAHHHDHLARVRGPRAHAAGVGTGKAADFLGFCCGRHCKHFEILDTRTRKFRWPFPCFRGYAMGLYLRATERRNRDGSAVAYYALAENVWNAQAKRSETQVIHNFGRADQLGKAALQRLVASIQRIIDADAVGALPTSGKASLPDIEIDAVVELGVVLAARALWEELGIGEAIRTRLMRAHLSAPHEMALFAMAAQRLDDPGSKLSCATRWLPDIAWLPEAGPLAVDQLYRALDFLAVCSEAIERDVFLRSADLLRLDVDLIFYDTTTAYFEIDEPDKHCELWDGKLFAPLRQRGHSKEGRDNQPQVVVAMAVTRDGMPVRSWVLPGNTADVATVARIKQDLHAWRLGRCLFVGDGGMYS